LDSPYWHIRLFDLSLDVEEAEQEYHLQAELPSRPGSHPLARAVGFAFGGEHLWDRFTVRPELIGHLCYRLVSDFKPFVVHD
jgi:hypothetical protein